MSLVRGRVGHRAVNRCWTRWVVRVGRNIALRAGPIKLKGCHTERQDRYDESEGVEVQWNGRHSIDIGIESLV